MIFVAGYPGNSQYSTRGIAYDTHIEENLKNQQNIENSNNNNNGNSRNIDDNQTIDLERTSQKVKSKKCDESCAFGSGTVNQELKNKIKMMQHALLEKSMYTNTDYIEFIIYLKNQMEYRYFQTWKDQEMRAQ